jgi:hypothetical protein
MKKQVSEEQAYHQLLAYSFQSQHYLVHQHVVDAYAAQTASEQSKAITVVFALAGLYLHIERGYTGPEAERAHMRMVRARKDWPRLPLPKERGAITAAEVMRFPKGAERDVAIERWSRAVWEAWREQHDVVAELVRSTVPELRSSGRD